MSNPEMPAAPDLAERGGKRRVWLWVIIGLLVGIPLLVTLIGALTSPPHVRRVPVGQIIYLEADQPSEKTTVLRGLRVVSSDGTSRELLHETEPQDVDAGVREWFTEPAISPDGRNVAYIRQAIVILDETQTEDTQLCVVSMDGAHPKPRLLLDLTQKKLKQPVGLAWTNDSAAVVFLNDNQRCTVNVDGGAPALARQTLADCPALKTNPLVSATYSPAFAPDGSLLYGAAAQQGPLIIDPRRNRIGSQSSLSGIQTFALSPDGALIALVPPRPGIIQIWDARRGMVARVLHARWGWSPFGGRHITSLRWSPDGRYVGYTVSKPPVPEGEVFYIDRTTGKAFQLPFRAGRAAWDWAR